MPELGIQKPSGSYIGNGTTLTIEVGFKPNVVTITNWTKDGSEIVRKHKGMENGTAVIDKNNKGKILQGAVTLTDTGFIVGESQYVNKSGNTYLWEVI